MNYIVLLEMTFCAVYGFEVLRNDELSNSIYLLIALIYACLKLFLYLVYDKKISKPISVIILLYTGIAGWFFYPILVFFPLSLNQVNLFAVRKGWGVSLLSLFWLFILPNDFIIEFLLALSFSVIIIYIQKEYMSKIKRLDAKVDSLQKSQGKMKGQLETYSQITENITYQSQLEERNKLSQTLHDELGHTLSGNILRLEAIKLILDKDVSKSKNMLQEVIDNLRNGMDSVRAILKAAKPELSTVNIANLQMIIDNVVKQSDVNIKLNYNSDINEMNQSMWQAVIPNIKEALTNMMKYSKAENCTIEFMRLNKIYRVSIQDDGLGSKSFKKGLGMIGIEERMALIDGNAIFDSTNGFSVTMIFPI